MAWTDWIGGFRRYEFPRFLSKTKRRQRRPSQRERHRAAVRLETLEPRLLLAFEPVSPLGSLIYQDRWWADFETSSETDSFTIELDAGQTLAGLALPGDGGIRASIEVVDPSGTSLGVFDAAEAGQPAVFQTLAVADAGVYRIDVTSLEGTGPYSVQLLLNAAGEEESYTGSNNDAWATAQDLSSSLVALPNGGDRLALVGQTGTGTLVDVMDIGFDGGALTQPVKGMTEFESGTFLLSDGDFLYELTTDGAVHQLGNFSNWTTGLAFVDDDLYAATGNTNQLRQISPATGENLATIPLTLTGSTVNGATALATHPLTGQLYAILRLTDSTHTANGPRELAVVDVTTGAVTAIGSTGDRFSAIAFDGSGQLYGVTGTGGLVPDTLYRISTTDGSTARVTQLAGGGEALAFHASDGFLYRAAGGGWAGAGILQRLVLQDVEDPADHFAFPLAAGQVATLLVSGDLDIGIQLLAGDGTPLALGLAVPEIQGAAIRDFTAAVGGTYVARVTAAELTSYRLIVTRDSGFELEPNNSTRQAAALGVTGGVLGHVRSAQASEDSVSGTATTTFTLFDQAGFRWDIGGDGSIGDGTSDAFDGGFQNGGFGWFNLGNLEAAGRELVLGPYDAGGIQITRKVYVSDQEGFARFLDTYTNTSDTLVGRSVNLYTNLGSDGSETVVGTSSGDDLVTTADNWIVTEDNYRSDPTVGHVIAGPGAQRPTAFTRAGDQINFAFDLWLHPGETQIVMSFGVQDWNTGAVLDRVAALEQTPQVALVGMTAAELAAVVNFELAPDYYWFEVAEPTTLSIFTGTPGDGPGEPLNGLDPTIELYTADGTWLAADDNGGVDGRNAELVYSVTEFGTYCVRVQAVAGVGPYTLRVSSSESGGLAVEPFAVVDTDLPLGQKLVALPASAMIQFSHGLLLTSIDASDLTITDPLDNMFTPAQVEVLDGDRLWFDLSGLPVSSGFYVVELAAGEVLDVRGQPLQEFSGSFELDSSGPTVTAASLSSGDVLTPGPLTFWATFSDPMREAELGPEDVLLHGVFSDQYLAPTFFSYDTAEKKVTVEFPSLPEDMYRLTLLSGDGHFEGEFGHDLDGDGDGAAGGHYVVEFSVDSDTWEPLPTVEPVWPHGSLIYRTGVSAAIFPAGDVDTYTIDLDAGQAVSLVVWPAETLRPEVEITRLDGWESLGNAQGSTPGEPAFLQTVEIETAGTYVISVSGGSSDLTVGGYALDLVLNANIEAESVGGMANDTLATAEDIDGSVLTLGVTGQRGAVLGDLPAGASDVDWYAFSLAENQRVSLSVTGQGTGSFTLDLFDAAGQRLAAGSAPGVRGNVDQRIGGYQAPSAGTYYAVVSGTGQYSLVVSRDIALDVEPNTRPADAQWLSPAQAVVGSLGRMEEGGAVGTIRVALLRNSYMSADVQLADSADFDFQPVLVGASQIDTVEKLNAFDVVVIGDQSSRTQLQTIAPALRAWVEGGGGVVGTGWLVYAAGSATGTPIADIDAIIPVNTSGYYGYQGTSFTVTVIDQNHPVTEGVSSFSVSGAYAEYQSIDVGATLLGTVNNQPAIVTGLPGAGRAVYLGPVYSQSGSSYPALRSGMADRLFEQAVAWAARGGKDTADQYLIRVNAGDQLIITTATPGDGPYAPENELDPLLELYDPAGTLVASNNNWPFADGGDGRNSRILYTVPADAGGTYRVRVSAVMGAGDYTLQVAGATGVREVPLTVTAASIDDGTTLAAWPATLQLDFDSALLLTSVQAADLTVNGTPADSVTVVDGDTLRFDMTGAHTGDGAYTIALAADVMENLFGTGNTAFSLSFTLDTTSPVVTASSIDAGEIIEPGNLTYTVTFSEALDTAGLGPEDVTLVENTFGTTFAPTGFDYDPDTYTLTVDFHGLYDGDYVLTLISGPNAFRDLVGNQLNGWPSEPLPSGQGHPVPDDFVLSFFVDAAGDLLYPIPLEPKLPLGSLIFDSSVRGSIHVAGDSDGYAVQLDGGQTVTVVLAPQAGLQGSIELLGPDGASIGTASAGAEDGTVVLQTAPAADAGTYRVLIGGLDSSTGGYTARLILNAAVELEEHGGARNDDLDSAQDLTGSLIDLGGGIGRAAVLGQAQRYAGGTVSRISGLSYGASLATLTDGVFRSRGTSWTSGTVYWYDVDTEFEIALDSVQTVTGGRVQADNNDAYQLDWFDADEDLWKPLWTIPNYSDRIGGGVITRPDYPWTDSDEFQVFAEPVTTDRFRFRAVSGDGMYSASEIQLLVAGDFYSLALSEGEVVSSVLTATGAGSVSLELLDGSGTPLAVGFAGYSNVTQAISDFVAPTAGTYFWRVTSDGQYSLVLVQGAAFDLEFNDTAETAQPISTTGAVLGHLWRTAGESFEDGQFPQWGWSTYSSWSGWTRVMDQHGAADGNFALVMDSASGWALNEAIWTVDLSEATQATLSFQHRSFGSETNQILSSGFVGTSYADGVSFSPNGNNWYRLWSPVLSTTWQTVTVECGSVPDRGAGG